MSQLKVRKITRFLFFISVGLSLASIAGQFSRYILDHGNIFGLVKLFNVDQENNLPSLYSSCLLLLSSFLLGKITWIEKKINSHYLGHWGFLSIIFLFLSLDELIGIHEGLGRLIPSSVNVSKFLFFSWIVPAAFFLVVLVLIYWRFIFNLPPRIRRLLLISGALYVGGALGMELMAGFYLRYFGWQLVYDNSYGWQGFGYALLTTIEELCEMLGVVLFVHTLLAQIDLLNKKVQTRWITEQPWMEKIP